MDEAITLMLLFKKLRTTFLLNNTCEISDHTSQETGVGIAQSV
jgi:hypothetical protein